MRYQRLQRIGHKEGISLMRSVGPYCIVPLAPQDRATGQRRISLD